MKNRQPLIILISLALAVVVTGLMGVQLSKARGDLKDARALLQSIEKDKDGFIAASMRVSALERKRGLSATAGIAQAAEDTFGPMGLKEKLSSVKPIPSSDPTEDRAEVALEGLNVNELANAIYGIESAPMLIVIRKASIKSSFLKPGLLDLTMTLSLIKPEQ